MSTHFMNEHNRPENPYKAGNSVGNSPAFVGRDDILKEVERVVRHPNDHAIVLYGQRRIGKTSVLRELEAKLSKDIYCPVFFDLQDRAQLPLDFVLRELAHKISDVLHQGEPELGSEPEVTFRKVWLPEVLDNLPQSLVLLFDEFDVLDNPKDEKAAGAAFFPYLRELLEIDHRRLNFVFVIGRKIDDLSNIVLSLFKGTPSKHVSLLDREETFKLVCLSETNNTLQWTEETIEKIWQQAGGHPYLTQRWCSRVWDNIYDKSPAKLPIATLEDVDTALPEAFKASHGTIAWLWDGLPPAEKVVASALAGAGAKAITEAQLKTILNKSGVRMVLQELQNAPRTLQDWDLIEPANGGYHFRVELLRRWIVEYKPLSKVQEELDRVNRTADKLYQAASDFHRDSKFEEALTSSRQAVKSNPNHVGANLLLAEILLAQEKIGEARNILEQLYKYQPSAAHEQLIQALLILAQTSDDENEQISLYKRVLELDAEHPEAKSQLPRAWEQQGDKASKLGDLGTALTAYRNAALDDKGAEVEEKIRQQTQLHLQTQSKLKSLKWNVIPGTLGIVFVMMVVFFLTYRQHSIQLENQKIEILSEQLKQSIGKQKEQVQEIKNLLEQLITTTEWYELISSIKLGEYRVMVGSYEQRQSAEKKSEEITTLSPRLPLEVMPFQLSEKWSVTIGESYSQEDAERLMVRIRKLYQKDAYIINPGCDTQFECLLMSLKTGNFRVIITTYGSGKKLKAERYVTQLRKEYPGLNVGKYAEKTKGKWRVYIGCYTKKSAKRLRRWAVEDAEIAQQGAYIIQCD